MTTHYYEHITLNPSSFEEIFLKSPLPERIPLNEFKRKTHQGAGSMQYSWHSTNDPKTIITQPQYERLYQLKLIQKVDE
jgi:hypothetical protein